MVSRVRAINKTIFTYIDVLITKYDIIDTEIKHCGFSLPTKTDYDWRGWKWYKIIIQSSVHSLLAKGLHGTYHKYPEA